MAPPVTTPSIHLPLTSCHRTDTDGSDANGDKLNYAVSLRKAFVPSSGHRLILAADFSQLELRILAHLSRDANLVKALKDGKKDVFKSVAASWLRLPGGPDLVTDSQVCSQSAFTDQKNTSFSKSTI